MAFPTPLFNRNTGAQAVGYIGFSWTCLFFGPFPALFRGHFVGFVVKLVLGVCTLGLSALVFMFVYNKWHYNWLLSNGFAPSGMHQHSQQNVINVSVGNVGTADHSRHAHFHPAPVNQDNNSVPAGSHPLGIQGDGVRSLPRSL